MSRSGFSTSAHNSYQAPKSCDKPNHFHVWPVQGELEIERCEHYCLYCRGPKAQKKWSSAWFLRRHVRETHAKIEFPHLTVSEGWARRPQGNTRPANKKQRAPGSNKKRVGTKKERLAIAKALEHPAMSEEDRASISAIIANYSPPIQQVEAPAAVGWQSTPQQPSAPVLDCPAEYWLLSARDRENALRCEQPQDFVASGSIICQDEAGGYYLVRRPCIIDQAVEPATAHMAFTSNTVLPSAMMEDEQMFDFEGYEQIAGGINTGIDLALRFSSVEQVVDPALVDSSVEQVIDPALVESSVEQAFDLSQHPTAVNAFDESIALMSQDQLAAMLTAAIDSMSPISENSTVTSSPVDNAAVTATSSSVASTVVTTNTPPTMASGSSTTASSSVVQHNPFDEFTNQFNSDLDFGDFDFSAFDWSVDSTLNLATDAAPDGHHSPTLVADAFAGAQFEHEKPLGTYTRKDFERGTW